MTQNLHIFKNQEDLADQFADQIMDWVQNHTGKTFNMAISGGKTPDLLFSVLAQKFAASALWQKVHFWWVDERMVSPENAESNFGVADKLFFSKISIPEENIQRIKGENEPDSEALAYSQQIQNNLKQQNGWPVFDLILLGMGDDGHTASIFPDQMELLESDKICAVAKHPSTGQKRITLTGKVINNADKVCFLITGENKAERISEIFSGNETAHQLPAVHIKPLKNNAFWYVDEFAAEKIGK
ncbi:MAG: 6-phosphogluconolactonase [Prolixibacteraceae bacterium]|nr:6-phosphogluconolactonase [Prolixibacteraceae bacterium]